MVSPKHTKTEKILRKVARQMKSFNMLSAFYFHLKCSYIKSNKKTEHLHVGGGGGKRPFPPPHDPYPHELLHALRIVNQLLY